MNKGELENDFTENYNDPSLTSPQTETDDEENQEDADDSGDEMPKEITGTLQALAMFSKFDSQENFLESLQGSKTTLNALINGLTNEEVRAIKTLLGKPEMTKFDLKFQANQDFDIITTNQP